MKIFVILLLVAFCQADTYDKDEDDLCLAFRFLASIDINNIAQAVENEVNELVQERPTDNDVQWLRALASDFSDSLQEEMNNAVTSVVQSGHQNHQVTNGILENLRRAADDIAQGLNMTGHLLERFVENVTKGFDDLEESGLLEIDLDPIFEGLTDKAMKALDENTRKRRDIRSFFGHVNESLRRVISKMNGRFDDLHDFFRDHMKTSRDKMNPQIENIKILARNFIKNIKAAQRSVLQHAIEFFTPFANKMGDIYIELMTKINNRLQRLNEKPIPAIY